MTAHGGGGPGFRAELLGKAPELLVMRREPPRTGPELLVTGRGLLRTAPEVRLTGGNDRAQRRHSSSQRRTRWGRGQRFRAKYRTATNHRRNGREQTRSRPQKRETLFETGPEETQQPLGRSAGNQEASETNVATPIPRRPLGSS